MHPPVGASLLAKNARTPRGFRPPASSLTSIASKLAPTDAEYICKKLVGWQAAFASRLAPTEEHKQSNGRSAYPHALHHSTGRALARLPLLILILIHPPPRQAERRCSS